MMPHVPLVLGQFFRAEPMVSASGLDGFDLLRHRSTAPWSRSPSRQDVQPSEAAIVITRPESPISGDFRAVGERQKINRSRRAAA
jgi:hypothetical protein